MISQAEARRLKKRVHALEAMLADQRRGWRKEWPGGTHLATADFSRDPMTAGRLQAARRLNHAVVAVLEGNGTQVEFFALKLPEEPL